jgi:hypothetical protein
VKFRIPFFLRTHRLALTLLIVGVCGIGLYAFLSYQSPDEIIRECGDATNKPLCYSTHIEQTLRTHGIPAAFDELAVAYDNDPEFAGTCHAVTHDLGKAAYEEFHKTGKTELTSKASYCGYGFYHGFLDALLVDTNDLAEARSFCTYVGLNVPHPPSADFAEGSCYHGIGHGITDGTDPRLWGNALSIVRPGLALCTKVAGGNDTWESRCASGVFNALGNMYPDAQYKLDPGTDPYALCRDGNFSPIDEEACYDQMNTQAAALGNNNLGAMVGFTNRIQDSHYRSVALHEAVSYYVQILKQVQKDLSVQDVNVCELPTNELKDSCVSGFVGGVFEFGSPGAQYKEVLAVCSSDSLASDLRGSCFSALVTNSKYFYTPDVVAGICKDVPVQYGALCQT